MMKIVSYVLLCVLAGTVTCQDSPIPHKIDRFYVLYEWNYINFTWPNSEAYTKAVDKGSYKKENVIITGVKQHGNRLFLSLPRLKEGVPATLGYIPLSPFQNDTSPSVIPYPSLAINVVGNCTAFQSVHSFEIDRTGTMWAIDIGRTATMVAESDRQKCPPSLTLVDLVDETKPLDRFIFPEDVANANSYLSDIVLDDTDEGYAYITDSGSDPGIIVYSKRANNAWKVRDPSSMKAEDGAQHFSINGTQFDLSGHIDGIALGPRYLTLAGFNRNVYYSPLSSYRMYYVKASELQKHHNTHELKVETLGVKPSQSAGMIMDERGILYYGLIGNYSIAQWNSFLPFVTEQHIVAKDPNFIQWPDRFSFDANGNIYTVVNRRQSFINNSVNTNDINIRILKSNVGNRNYMYSPTKQEYLDQEKKKHPINAPPPSTPPPNFSNQIICNSVSILAAVFLVILFN